MHHRLILRALSLVLLITVAGVIILGAYTRLADAGLGCPDWPTCYGHLWVPQTEQEIVDANARFAETPVETDKTWPEQIHRIFASSLGVLILITFGFINAAYAKHGGQNKVNSVVIMLGLLVLATIKRVAAGVKYENLLTLSEGITALIVLAYFINVYRVHRSIARNPINTTFIIASTLAGLVVLQGLFGMWTVTLKLWPQVVTAHLLGGFSTLCLIVLLLRYLWFTDAPRLEIATSVFYLGLAAFIVTLLQIALGGWLSSNYAALACPDFPLCQGSIVPYMDFSSGFNVFQQLGPNYLYGKLDNEGRTAIHFSHRVGAIVVSVSCAAYCLGLFISKTKFTNIYATLILSTLFVQITLGVSNVVMQLPIKVAVTHNAVGALLLVILLLSIASFRRTPAEPITPKSAL